MGMLGIHEGVDCSVEPSRTKQSFRDDVNINKIIARFDRTGMVSHLNSKTPFYGDVSSIVGYQEALNKVKEADELFGRMSAEIRNRFKNDPALMIEFLSDPVNNAEALKLGMIVAPPEPVVAEPAVDPK